jgi:hypothetical protein
VISFLTRAGGISDRSLPVNMSLQWHRCREGRKEGLMGNPRKWPAGSAISPMALGDTNTVRLLNLDFISKNP